MKTTRILWRAFSALVIITLIGFAVVACDTSTTPTNNNGQNNNNQDTPPPPPPTPTFPSEGGFTINSITGEIISFTGTVPADLVIPSTVAEIPVTRIGFQAFFNRGVETVVFPEGIREIGAQAFASNRLVDLVIPPGVTYIGLRAFQSNQLETVILPSSITEFGYLAFNLNQGTMERVTVPFANLAAADAVWGFPHAIPVHTFGDLMHPWRFPLAETVFYFEP